MPAGPHDALFKSTFSQPDVARSQLEAVLPKEVRARLDLASLEVCPGSFVDEELRHLHADLLYAVRAREGGGASLVYVLFEHQSSFDPLMPLRLLRYVVRVWERWLREHPAASTVPICIPVLLHQGPGGWQAAPELASILDADPALLDVTRRFVPHFRFVLDDLGALPLEAIASRALHALGRLVAIALWSSRSIDRLRAAAPLMREIVAGLSRDERTRALLVQLFVYLLRAAQPDVEESDVRTILFEVAGPCGAEDVMNAAEQLIEQGRADGLHTAIATALSARGLPLSELGRARVAGCSDVATLTRWLARAVTATSEADVFAVDDAR